MKRTYPPVSEFAAYCLSCRTALCARCASESPHMEHYLVSPSRAPPSAGACDRCADEAAASAAGASGSVDATCAPAVASAEATVELLQRVFLCARFGADLARDCDDVGTVALGHALALGRADQVGVSGGECEPPAHTVLRAVSACPLFVVSRATGTGARLHPRHPRGPEALALAAPHLAALLRPDRDAPMTTKLERVARLLPVRALSARVAAPACLFLEGGWGGAAPAPLHEAAGGGARAPVALLPAPRAGPLPPPLPLPRAPPADAPPPPPQLLPSADALRRWVRALLARAAAGEGVREVVGLAVDGDGAGGIARVALACGGDGSGGEGEGVGVVVACALALAAAAVGVVPTGGTPPPPPPLPPLSLFYPLLPLLLHPGVLKVVASASVPGCALDQLAAAAGLPALHVLALDALTEELGLACGEWGRAACALRCGEEVSAGGSVGGADAAAGAAAAGIRAHRLRAAALGCAELRAEPPPPPVTAAWLRSELAVLALPLPRAAPAGRPPPPQPVTPWYLPCACCGLLAGHYVTDCPKLTLVE
jgi:hypothetical protein